MHGWRGSLNAYVPKYAARCSVQSVWKWICVLFLRDCPLSSCFGGFDSCILHSNFYKSDLHAQVQNSQGYVSTQWRPGNLFSRKISFTCCELGWVSFESIFHDLKRIFPCHFFASVNYLNVIGHREIMRQGVEVLNHFASAKIFNFSSRYPHLENLSGESGHVVQLRTAHVTTVVTP